MASKRDIFFEYLSESGKMNALDTGSVIGWYDWTETFGSNKYILNSKYPNPQQDTIIDSLYVNAENFPLYQLSTGAGYVHESGRGYFDSETVFQKVNHGFYSPEWMAYVDFGPYDSAPKKTPLDRGKVLFTSMESPTDSSGFAVGLNGANKIYFQYVHTGGYLETVTANSIELQNKNLISIAYRNHDEKIVSGAVYDKKGNSIHGTARTKASVGSNTLNIGGYPSPDSSSTGFSGYINNIAFFSGITLSQHSLNLGGAAFALSGYQGEQTGRQEYYKVFTTGSGVLTTQVTGTGITGYERVAVAGPAGSTVYMQSGVTGELTGQVVVFASGLSGSFALSRLETFQESKLITKG